MSNPSTGAKQDHVSIRDNNGRFGAGNKTGGRKRIPDDVKDMLMAATKDAAQLLIDTIRNEAAPIKIRTDCANAVMDRVYGKAAQPIDGNIGGAIEVILGGNTPDYAK